MMRIHLSVPYGKRQKPASIFERSAFFTATKILKDLHLSATKFCMSYMRPTKICVRKPGQEFLMFYINS